MSAVKMLLLAMKFPTCFLSGVQLLNRSVEAGFFPKFIYLQMIACSPIE